MPVFSQVILTSQQKLKILIYYIICTLYKLLNFILKLTTWGGGGDGIINYSFVPWSTLFNPHVKADHGLCDPLQGLDPSCSHLKLFHIWPGDQNYD